MKKRQRFVLSLALVNLAVLLLAWNTWCERPITSYSWSTGWERFWNRQIASHDLGTFAVTTVIALLVSAGIFFCVDAFVWDGADRRRKADGPLRRTG